MSALPPPAPQPDQHASRSALVPPSSGLPTKVSIEPSRLEEHAKRRRGRPPGQKMRIAAQQLKHHHFSFLRSLILGIKLADAWERFLAFEGGPNDERHRGARARELISLVRLGADERGLQARADVALAGLVDLLPRPSLPSPAAPALPPATPAPAPSPAAPAVPSLEDWIAQKCDETGEDPEDTRISEWQERYNDEFDLDQVAAPQPATAIAIATPAPSPPPTVLAKPALPSVDARVDALNILTNAMATPPALADGLGVWLSPELAQRLANTTVDGKRLPLMTVGNLIAMVNLYHHRWWVHVPRLGADRAARLVAWLAPLAEQLGHPLKEISLKPLAQITRERAAELAVLDIRAGDRHTVFGVVPLDRLAVPSELSGKNGVFRAADRPNVFDVDNDLAAIFKWLARHTGSPRTISSYQLIIERFYLWSLWIKRKPLSSLSESDFSDYEAFLAKPPADWIQTRRAGRGTSEWRPFKGPASPDSIKLNFTVIASLIGGLHEGGYLSANAIKGAMPSTKKKLLAMNIDRSFNDAQWSWLMTCWKAMYLDCGPTIGDGEEPRLFPDTSHPDQQFLRAAGLRRTRLVLELGATTGLRLLEFVTTRRQALVQRVVDGRTLWMITILGKGNKEREVPLYDDIKALLDQHHADMQAARTHFNPASRGFRTLKNPTARPVREDEDVDDTVSLTDVVPLNEPQLPLPPPPSLLGGSSPTFEDDGFDITKMPLVGALRRAPRAKVPNHLGLLETDEKAPQNADQYGSLDPNAMYQSLKRFFADCSRRASSTGADLDPETLLDASTHWLRHFFANSAAKDGVDLPALKDAMGHASLTTTSIYLRTERTRLVSELAKMRRRS